MSTGQVQRTRLSWLGPMAYSASEMQRPSPPDSVCTGARLFRAWRAEHKISQERACTLLGVSHFRTCHEWEWGAKLPSLVYAIRIEEMTRGHVTVEMWGHTETDIAPFIAFGVRRARKAGLIPPAPTYTPSKGAIILGGNPRNP